MNEIKVGDVFYTSWGYDQTNYDYIVVLSISTTGRTATCQRIGCSDVPEGQCHRQKPDATHKFGDAFRMQIKNGGYYADKIVLRGSYPFCYDGKLTRGTRLDTFLLWDGQKEFYETDSQFGH